GRDAERGRRERAPRHRAAWRRRRVPGGALRLEPRRAGGGGREIRCRPGLHGCRAAIPRGGHPPPVHRGTEEGPVRPSVWELTMRLFERFRSARQKSAAHAKERLQVIIAHSRAERDAPDYLPKLKQELMEVIRKYVHV